MDKNLTKNQLDRLIDEYSLKEITRDCVFNDQWELASELNRILERDVLKDIPQSDFDDLFSQYNSELENHIDEYYNGIKGYLMDLKDLGWELDTFADPKKLRGFLLEDFFTRQLSNLVEYLEELDEE